MDVDFLEELGFQVQEEEDGCSFHLELDNALELVLSKYPANVPRLSLVINKSIYVVTNAQSEEELKALVKSFKGCQTDTDLATFFN